MRDNTLLDEIQDLNLSYLLLAQRMLREDRTAAMFRLKIDADTAEVLSELSSRQLSGLARTNQLLCGFAGYSAESLRQLTDNPRDQGMGSLHASLLMARGSHGADQGASA